MLKVLGDYSGAIEKYTEFIANDRENKKYVYFAYGHIGQCLEHLNKYDEAIPYLTKSIRYFNGENINQLTIGSVTDDNRNIGSLIISRGFCRAKMDDKQGSIEDLNKGIRFNEMLLKTDKFNTDEVYESLGFAYFLRGVQSLEIKPNSGCSDFRKAAELGESRAFELIKEFCN